MQPQEGSFIFNERNPKGVCSSEMIKNEISPPSLTPFLIISDEKTYASCVNVKSSLILFIEDDKNPNSTNISKKSSFFLKSKISQNVRYF